jgi:hypothetical protein
VERRYKDLLTKSISAARARARKRFVPFDLTIADIEALWIEQEGGCAISGIEFSDLRFDDAFVKYPFAPSPDRIVPNQGYTKGNVRLVCTAANFARNEWGDNVLRQVAHGIVATERTQEREWYRIQRLKIKQAERAAKNMKGAALKRQGRAIAGLKATLTKGPARLRGAGGLARHTRLKRQA